MGRCPTCGASSIFFVSTKQCFWCGKMVCNKCVPNWHGILTLKTQMETDSTPAVYGTAGFCSDACYYKFNDYIQKFPVNRIVATDIERFSNSVTDAWNQAILGAAANDYKLKVQHAIEMHTKNFTAIPWWDSTRKPFPTYAPFYNNAKIALVENLEKCGRTQDAAKIFEEL